VSRGSCEDGSVRTFGVDLASRDSLTAGSVVEWDPEPSVVEVRLPLSDDAIVGLATGPKTVVTAIDAPFGWPRDFAAAVHGYDAGGPFQVDGSLWLRETDRRIVSTTGRRPLSVYSDRIAYPAVRAARLLTRLGGDVPAARDGRDNVIEVYPAAAMIAWGIAPGRYKRPDALKARVALLESFEALLPGLDVQGHHDVLVATDHAIDALVAALVGRAFSLGQVAAIPTSVREAASVEGWIWVPDRPLGALVAEG
jgi:predicted nuclease with RNAse H fold